jgi:hypothetical protein
MTALGSPVVRHGNRPLQVRLPEEAHAAIAAAAAARGVTTSELVRLALVQLDGELAPLLGVERRRSAAPPSKRSRRRRRR